MATVQIQDHPIYTFTPQIRSHLESKLRNYFYDNFFKHVEAYLNKKQAYGVLIVDDESIGLIQHLFSQLQLTEFRIVFKEKLETQRSNPERLIAIYAIKPTKEKIELIAQDFGYNMSKGEQVKRLDEVKKIREQEKCCYQPYKNFNPYLYNGLFILANGAIDNAWLDNTGLKNILSTSQCFEYSINFIPKEPYYIDLTMPNGFQNIVLSDNDHEIQEYVEQQSSKLLEIIKFYNIQNVRIKYQKSSQIAEQIAQKVDNGLSGINDVENKFSTILIICDRLIDSLQIVQQSVKYGPMLLEQLEYSMDNNKNAVSKIFEIRSKQNPTLNDKVTEGSYPISHHKNPIFMALRGMYHKSAYNKFISAHNVYNQMHNFYYPNNTQKNTQIQQNSISITQKNGNNEEKTLHFEKLEAIETFNIQNVFKYQEGLINQFSPFHSVYRTFYDNKTILVIEAIQKILFSVLVEQQQIKELGSPKQVNGNTVRHEIARLSNDQSTQTLALKFLLYQDILYNLHQKQSNQHKAFQNDAANNIKKFVDQESQMLYNACQNLFQSERITENIKAYIQLWKALNGVLKKQGDQCIPQSLIELICQSFISGCADLLNNIFIDKTKSETYRPIKLPNNGYSQAKEMRLAKAKFYEASLNSRKIIRQQEQDDEYQFDQSQKIIIYMSGGTTFEEVAAVQSLTISTPQIGFFNTGIQQQQPYIILASDTIMNQSQYLHNIFQKEKAKQEIIPAEVTSQREDLVV